MKATVQLDFEKNVLPDLDFKMKDTMLMTHGIHPYPARMIPALANFLVKTCSSEGDTVLDPFCGSGTVLVEAVVNSRSAVGGDINPLALLLARVKTTPIDIKTLKRITTEFVPRIHQADKDKKYRGMDYPIPEFSLDLDFWFKPYVIKDLAFLKSAVEDFGRGDQKLLEFLTVCFSATVREVSNTRKREFKRYRMSPTELEKFQPDVLRAFTDQVSKSVKLMKAFNKKHDPECVAVPFRADARTIHIQGGVDAIITSPPYGDSNTTVAYGQFSSLLMEWIGINHGAWKKIDIQGLGGRPAEKDIESSPSQTLIEAYHAVKERSQLRADALKAFVFDYEQTIQAMHDNLKPGGKAAIVIGDRTVSGHKIKNDLITKELAASVGLEHVKTMGRRILFKTLPYQTIPMARAGSTDTVNCIGNEHVIILKRV